MLLNELDQALVKLGLDLDCPEGKRTRDRILIRYGEQLLDSKKDVCSKCWLKDNKGCMPMCEMNLLTNDPLKDAINSLSRYNDINLVSFICMYIIPVYEEDTGETGLMYRLASEFKKRWRKEFGEDKSDVGYLPQNCK